MSQKDNRSQTKIEDLLKRIEGSFKILSSNPDIEKIIPVMVDNMRTALASQLKMAISFGSSAKKIEYEDAKKILEICKTEFGMYDFAALYKNGNANIKKAVLDVRPGIKEYINRTEESRLFSDHQLSID